MARLKIDPPDPSLPASVSGGRGAIDSILEKYDEKVARFELEHSDTRGFSVLQNAKLAPRQYGLIPGFSYLDTMNQMLGDLVVLWGLNWICNEAIFPQFGEYSLKPGVLHRFGYQITADCGNDSLEGWVFYEGPLFGMDRVRKARDRLRQSPANIRLIVVNEEAIDKREREQLQEEKQSGEVLIAVAPGGGHARQI